MALIKKFRIKSFKKIKSIIEFENVTLAYGNRIILDNINFKINEGQIFGMLGPNGVGKSTIFNLITGLKEVDHGEIIIDGINTSDVTVMAYLTDSTSPLLSLNISIIQPEMLGPRPKPIMFKIKKNNAVDIARM